MVHHRGTPVTAAETKSSMKESLALIIDPTVKRKLILLILGSLLVSSLEVIGLLLIVPLVQLISSQQDSTGFLKILEEFFGNPNRSKLTIIIAGMVMTAFIVKAIFVTTFRWWATGVACDEEAKTSTNLLHIYMHAPYWIHLDRNTAEFVRTMNESVSQTYSAFIMGWITVISESIVAIGIAGVLIAVQPVAAISIAIYFLTAGLIYMKLTAKRSSATGRILNERIGSIGFWTAFFGFQLTFGSMFVAGLQGMPRRVLQFDNAFDVSNWLSTIGAYTIGVGMLIFLYAIITSWRSGEVAGSNPWGSHTLEWQTETPVPLENFPVLPVVTSDPYDYGVPDPYLALEETLTDEGADTKVGAL